MRFKTSVKVQRAAKRKFRTKTKRTNTTAAVIVNGLLQAAADAVRIQTTDQPGGFR